MKMPLMLLVTALLAGCGSGGSSAGGAVSAAPGQGANLGQQAGTATVVVSTRAASADTVLYAVEFKLNLPPGVSVSADPASGEVSAGALHAADGGALAKARYQPATAGTRGFVLVDILDSGGFTVGGLVTLDCTASAGAEAGAAGFSLESFSARDANGAPFPGIIPELAVQTP
jgi:hypothetical protein